MARSRTVAIPAVSSIRLVQLVVLAALVALLTTLLSGAVRPTDAAARAKVTPQALLPQRFPATYLSETVVRWQVKPAAYAGQVSVTDEAGDVLDIARASGGWVQLVLPPASLGTQRLTVRLAAEGQFRSAKQHVTMVVRGKRLVLGDRNAVVKPLLRRLDALRFHIPGLTNRYSKRVSDVVLAFQKAQGLARTATMGKKTWQALEGAKPMRPRADRKGTYIEVDKTRQILMLVRKRRVLGTLHVSTGKTGNTPEGWFRIYSKAPNALYRFMPFLRGFGIHGYIPVPPYPASHGCVREPMWAADWTYDHSRVGTRVFIYH